MNRTGIREIKTGIQAIKIKAAPIGINLAHRAVTNVMTMGVEQACTAPDDTESIGKATSTLQVMETTEVQDTLHTTDLIQA